LPTPLPSLSPSLLSFLGSLISIQQEVSLSGPIQMPLPRREPSRVVLSHLTGPRAPNFRRSVFRQQVRCDSNKADSEANNELSGKSFKGQLYESTATRLQRERAEQARFSQSRKEGIGAWGLPVSFGMCRG
jgi:hypothetical protein